MIFYGPSAGAGRTLQSEALRRASQDFVVRWIAPIVGLVLAIHTVAFVLGFEEALRQLCELFRF